MKTFYYYANPEPVFSTNIEEARFVQQLGLRVEVVTAASEFQAATIIFDRHMAEIRADTREAQIRAI